MRSGAAMRKAGPVAQTNKLTIRVTTARRTQSLYWASVGVEGLVPVNLTSGQLLGVPLSNRGSSDEYWNAILTKVLAEIPA